MKDELPKSVKTGNYIVNLESGSEGNGTHWTALLVTPQEALYYDPFGQVPIQEIVDFIKRKRGCRLAYTMRQNQYITSDNCGSFCLALMIYCHRHSGKLYEKANDFVNLFDDNPKNNDIRLGDFYRMLPDAVMPPQIKKLLK